MLHDKRRFTQPQQLSRTCGGQRAQYARMIDMSEQQSETVTVSGYGRKLCVLSEYVMRQAVCGYSAYGQRVLDAATRAATAVQLVA